jgi:hypothetical protein
LTTFRYRRMAGSGLLALALHPIKVHTAGKSPPGTHQQTVQGHVRLVAWPIFQPARLTGGVLFFAFFILAFRLRQRDLEFMIEPDFNWQLVEAWRSFLVTLDPGHLPIPFPDVYLDGQFIIYALVDVGLRRLVGLAPSLRVHFPNDLSHALGAALLTNILAYAGACTIFFAATYRLIGRVWLAAPLAIGLFLAPQMLDINIGRVDFLITLPLMIVFYCSCLLALGKERRRHALVLGAALALIATCKINGLFISIFPAFAAMTIFRVNRNVIARLAVFIFVSLVAFVIVYILLMGRYFYYLSLPEIIQNYRACAALLLAWAPTMNGPNFYYNIDLMLGAGWPFVGLYLLCASITIGIAVTQRRPAFIFLSICFVGLSIIGVFTPKYQRGGYHLLPVSFAMIALAVDALAAWPRRRQVTFALAMVGGLAFAATVATSFAKYLVVVAEREKEPVGLQNLKRAPRDWLRSHVAAETTVCIQNDSIWTLPPLDGFKVVYGPLALPYLDSAALAHTMPPDLGSLANQCPFVVTSDWHRAYYRGLMVGASQETADKWDSFFRSLDDRYPPVIFSSPVAMYSKSIFVNDLRGKQ